MTNKSTSSFGYFVTDEGTLTLAAFWILLAGPLLYSGRFYLGLLSLMLGFGAATCQAMEELGREDKATIRFNVLDARDVVDEIVKIDDSTVLLAALEALAMKKTKKKKKHYYEAHVLELACQEAAYVALGKKPDNDAIVAASISLLALVAKNKAVRARHCSSNNNIDAKKEKHVDTKKDEDVDTKKDKDVDTKKNKEDTMSFALSIPLQAMVSSLERIQDNEQPDESVEVLAAEVQRKCCLWLGALADNHVDLATKIVDEGGLDAVLSALDWFRHHEDVNNWGLWALFMLCYNHHANQVELVKLGGLQILCQSMTLNASVNIEVCRHGLAILFDLLRQQSQEDLISTQRVLEMRQIAKGAGLHKAVKAAMDAHYESMEIMGMGTDLLVSTGFEGDIPIYQPMD